MNRLPLSPGAATEIVPLFREMLKLCKVARGETVLLYGDTHTPQHYPAAFLGAAQDLGAIPAIMTVPTTSPAVQAWAPHDRPEARPKVIMEAWKNADLVIDMTTQPGQLYTPVTYEALKSGTRVLRVSLPLDDMQRMFPTPEVIRRVRASTAILERGTRLRMTSPAGTDVIFVRAPDRPVGHQDGVADEPGHWDMWPAGQVAVAPLEDRSEGVLVINTGDILLNLGRYVDRSITCLLREGRIVEIQGDGVDAFLLREWFAQWKDPRAYVVSHIGWGCHDKASWLRMTAHWAERGGLMDAESYGGDVQIAFGNNLAYTLRGANDTRAHIDIDCRDCSFYVDDALVVDRGVLVHPELA
jgi:2,5-dihydroxypyridine 5,6-dioxygenase